MSEQNNQDGQDPLRHEDEQTGPPVPPEDLEIQNASEEAPHDQPGALLEDAGAAQSPSPSPLERILSRLRKGAPPPREAKAMEKSRGLILLGVTLMGGLFLFFGLFTTDSSESKKAKASGPNLGRPQQQVEDSDAANRSAVPQLSVNTQQSNDTGELTEKDVLGTMRNQGSPAPRTTLPPPSGNLGQINFDDPALAEAYRRQGRVPPPRPTTVTDWNQAITEYQAQQPKPNAAPAALTRDPNVSDDLRKSSIVFVRTGTGATGTPDRGIQSVVHRTTSGLLSEGTALVARLQHAVNSVAKVPVVAVIEYNYERDGQLIVPAGTKAYGQLSEASPQGFVGIKFDTLEFPDGRKEEIAGSALSMERSALKGDVNGKNTGKKFLTRAATGLGTIAAYMVGGRGVGGSSGIDNTILLRERLASNIAMSGEQQLAMMAYQQNIVVSVPANTRFYLILHKDGIQQPARDSIVPGGSTRDSGAVLRQASSPQGELTAEEIQDLRQLRNEMRQMNQMFLNSQSARPESQ